MPFKKGQSGNPKGRPKGSKGRKSNPILAKYIQNFIGVMKGDSFYVYKHYHNGECFYIGKGMGSRAWEKSATSRNTFWYEYVSGIDFDYEIQIVAMGLTEREALAVESELILVNKPKCNSRFCRQFSIFAG